MRAGFVSRCRAFTCLARSFELFMRARVCVCVCVWVLITGVLSDLA